MCKSQGPTPGVLEFYQADESPVVLIINADSQAFVPPSFQIIQLFYGGLERPASWREG